MDTSPLWKEKELPIPRECAERHGVRRLAARRAQTHENVVDRVRPGLRSVPAGPRPAAHDLALL